MNFHKMPKAQVRPNDPPAMRQAIEFLDSNGIDARRPVNSDHQLKLDERTSYYPSRGTLFVDREAQAWTERGSEALEKWVRERPFISF